MQLWITLPDPTFRQTINQQKILTKPFGYPFAKLKELKTDTQANAFAAHVFCPTSR